MKYSILNRINSEKLVAVVRGKDYMDAYEISKKIIEGGIKLIEVTFTTPEADKTIELLVKEYSNDVLIGAGTVLDDITARIAILRGAKFVVSPHFDKSISILCNRYCIPYLPGCISITEVVKALESGSSVIKLFPGSLGGVAHMKSILGPIPQVGIMPSGGVYLDNMHEWIEAGAFAIGIGNALTKNVAKLGYESVKTETEKFVEKFNKIR